MQYLGYSFHYNNRTDFNYYIAYIISVKDSQANILLLSDMYLEERIDHYLTSFTIYYTYNLQSEK